MRQYRLITDQPLTGARNMAVDEAVLRGVINGESPPTLRFYAWQPPCLSLGYGQRWTDADLNLIAQNGWHIVRRATGGRAILHTDELTYSIVLPESHPLAEGGILESYRRISRGLVAGLSKLGMEPLAEKQTEGVRHVGPVCFEVPSHYEITTGDRRKLIGSAQLRRRGAILQHGSLPLTGDIGRIVDALTYDNAIHREEARFMVRQRAATLEDALGHVVTWHAAVDAMIAGFAEAMNADLIPGTLTDSEMHEADHLEHAQYSIDAWTRRK